MEIRRVVDHPYQDGLWRHEPAVWKPCYVCGHPTCWVQLDIGFKHPECDMYPSEEGFVRIVLGVKTVECCCGDEECWVLAEERQLLDEMMEEWT